VQAGARNARVQREQTLRARRSSVGGGFHELAHGVVEAERQLLDAVAQCIPRREAILARDGRLGVVEGERRPGELVVARVGQRRERTKSGQRVGVGGARIAEKILRLSPELIEVGRVWQGAGSRHASSMLKAGGPQAGQHGDDVPSPEAFDGRTQPFARTRGRPERPSP